MPEQMQQPMEEKLDLLKGLPTDMQRRLQEDLAEVTLEDGSDDGEHTTSSSWGSRVKSFLESGYRSMTSVAMEMITGPTAKQFGTMVAEVGVQEAEAKAARILKEHFWVLIDRMFHESESKICKYLFYTPTGRVITITAIAFPLSALLHMQAMRFKELAEDEDLGDRGDEVCAKLCLVLSRVLVRMATDEGVRALDLDNKVRKGLNWVVKIMSDEGVNPTALLGSTDKEYKQLGTTSKGTSKLFCDPAQGYNAKKKKRR